MATPPSTPTPTKRAPLKIHFSKPGCLPPVYVATDFTNPPWEPWEMDFKADSLSEAARFYFFKIFYDVQPGEHQYKFRVGPGDGGWAIDDDMDKVLDHSGPHENNWLFVKSPKPHTAWSRQPSSIAASGASNGSTHHTPTPSSTQKLEPTAPEATPAMKNTTPDVQSNEDTSSSALRPTGGAVTTDNQKNHIENKELRHKISLRDDVPSDLSTDTAMAAGVPLLISNYGISASSHIPRLAGEHTHLASLSQQSGPASSQEQRLLPRLGHHSNVSARDITTKPISAKDVESQSLSHTVERPRKNIETRVSQKDDSSRGSNGENKKDAHDYASRRGKNRGDNHPGSGTAIAITGVAMVLVSLALAWYWLQIEEDALV